MTIYAEVLTACVETKFKSELEGQDLRSQFDEHIGTPRMAAYFGVTPQTILRWAKPASGILTDVEVISNGGQKVKSYRPHHIQEAAVKLQYNPADVERIYLRIVNDLDAPVPFKDNSLRLLDEYKQKLNATSVGSAGK